jgi:hypothetical protein
VAGDKPPAGRGPRPQRAGRKAFLLRIPPELMEELRSWAGHELRSLNAHIEFLLREAIRRRRGGGG